MHFAPIQGRRIEYRMLPGEAGAGPTLVFLHEGLGSVGLWRDFPDKLAARLGLPALVYSRFGYGQSDGLLAANTPRFMHEEALGVLPALLDRLGIERPLLIGHSDGASIALIHAAASRRPVHGLVLMAPHVFVEPICLDSIARIRETYFNTDLKQRLARHHAHVDDAFLGWADTWLLPEFRSWSIEDLLPRRASAYAADPGPRRRVRHAGPARPHRGRRARPVSRLVLADCGHSPQRDQEAAVLQAIAMFATNLLRDGGD